MKMFQVDGRMNFLYGKGRVAGRGWITEQYVNPWRRMVSQKGNSWKFAPSKILLCPLLVVFCLFFLSPCSVWKLFGHLLGKGKKTKDLLKTFNGMQRPPPSGCFILWVEFILLQTDKNKNRAPAIHSSPDTLGQCYKAQVSREPYKT